MLSSSRRTVIDIQKEEIKKEKDAIQDLKRQLRDKDDEITDMVSQMEEAKRNLWKQVEEHAKEIAALNSIIVNLKSEKQLLMDENESLRELPDQQAVVIENLNFENEKIKTDNEDLKDKLQASVVTIELLTELKNSNKDKLSSLQQDMEDQHRLQEGKVQELQQALDAGNDFTYFQDKFSTYNEIPLLWSFIF